MAAAAAAATVDDTDVRERLLARWPGRKEQINTLLGLLGAPYDDAAPIFVHGPPVTGKSSVVRDVLAALKRPCAYTSLVGPGRYRPCSPRHRMHCDSSSETRVQMRVD